MKEEPELHEITAPSGKKYSFRRMNYTEKNKFMKLALSRLRGQFTKLDNSGKSADGDIFSVAIRSEMQLVVMMNTFVKGDGIPEGTKLEDSNINNLLDARDYDVLNAFTDKLNYPNEEVKKNSVSSSGTKETPQIKS